ncbi:sugar transferase [Fructobacillus sp. M1-13]|uniref:Sugar transferase n=1 Tax=Fructobacillus papyriferae TaxID=2713171 RepID=A0ABS5QQ98_9LACO|nr:sugar transferase [Fructobacillus papyriferae]MBS9335365.1 sugar transferase [Fructobacillus papyriferae]MCD2158966.1 sugar transferase [Fructobacillus papyriferae]
MNYITHTIEPWMPEGALKAKADVATIAMNNGWTRLPIERYNDVRFSDIDRQKKIATFLSDVRPGDTIVHQFPTYMSEDFEKSFQQKIKEKGAHYVLFIHDFEPLRVSRENAWEWSLAEQAGLIVAHSQKMITALRQHGVSTAAITLDLFDYLGKGPTSFPAFSKSINYAGTWQKAPWLKNYQGPALKLFGSRPKRWKEVTLPDSVDWVGSFSPEDIPLVLKSGFGLLWDSDYEDKLFQSYTKVNAPHKASLYLKAGLPLIVWSKSGLADLVRTEQIGFTIDKLTDLNEKLAALTKSDYETYQKNLLVLRERIDNGFYTSTALDKIVCFFD